MDVLKDLLLVCESVIDTLKKGVQERRGFARPLQIVAFHWYGTHECLEIRGRLLINKGIRPASTDDTILDNIVNMYKRMESDELPGVKLIASYQDEQAQTVSDEEGYFRVTIRPTGPIDEQKLWYDIGLHVSDQKLGKTQNIGRVLVPSKESSFGVISDIDDTVIETGITSLFETLGNTFLKNASTRLPFIGVKEFYNALQDGTTGKMFNPIYYLSNGPWNLFDFLDEFMKLNELPTGPILLRDYGLDEEKFIADDSHKIKQITDLLNTYPQLPFVLIGDSGEKDPEIYQHIVHMFPQRIKAIYIRDVTSEPRDSEVKKIAAEVTASGVDMLLMENTGEAAKHAVSIGLIDEKSLARLS